MYVTTIREKSFVVLTVDTYLDIITIIK